MACIKTLVNKHSFTAHIVRYPVNQTAPFSFKAYANVNFYERNKFTSIQLIELVKNIKPSIIICAGWSDKTYLKICKAYFSNIPTVLSFDNPWTGTFKQKAYSYFAPYYFKSIFSHVWVPGEDHKTFAQKLGFRTEQIHKGLYSADFDLFHRQFLTNKVSKQKHFPHRILYVGRYTELKGVKEMWQAFIEWQNENENDWELWCLGRGDLENDFPVHNKIKNFGFVQPDDLSKYITQCGVFILPSHIEHWGVVIHEYAAAGFPLISNRNTYAANFFLKDKHNGFMHKSSDKNSIKEVFNLLLHTSDVELIAMGERSAEMAKQITPETWSDTIIKLIKY